MVYKNKILCLKLIAENYFFYSSNNKKYWKKVKKLDLLYVLV